MGAEPGTPHCVESLHTQNPFPPENRERCHCHLPCTTRISHYRDITKQGYHMMSDKDITCDKNITCMTKISCLTRISHDKDITCLTRISHDKNIA